MLTLEGKLELRAAVNTWIGENFPQHRTLLTHEPPVATDGGWRVTLTRKVSGGSTVPLGHMVFSTDGSIASVPEPASVISHLTELCAAHEYRESSVLIPGQCEFRCGDGIEAASKMKDQSIDFLLTDPPYGISRRYACEGQVPRRLRKDGSDFIMPRGYFGEWDEAIDPHAWTNVVLPKVGGWALTFCAQAQIGTYCEIFSQHGFVAVGPMVWQKTNPVPFNHKFKPINAWEAIVVGKRPSTPFNGRMVHNVFLYKSPSPQQRIHPTQKPLPLVEEFVSLFSQPDSLVFDPFAGSATTVVGALNLSRRVIAYERDSELFGAAARRVDRDVSARLLP